MKIDYEKDFKKLAMVSDVAKMYFSNKYEMTVADLSDKPLAEQHEDTAFHPTGKCGCILLDDDYMLGIRCDHLMWAEGFHEHHRDLDYKDNTILIWGNHKGNLSALLYMFDNKEIILPSFESCSWETSSSLPSDIKIVQVHYKGQNDYQLPAVNSHSVEDLLMNDGRFIIAKKDIDNKYYIYDDANGKCYESEEKAVVAYYKKHKQ